jgi:hypothetical protein
VNNTVTAIGVVAGLAVAGLVGWLIYEARTAPFDPYDDEGADDDELDQTALPGRWRAPYAGDGE